MQAGYNADGLRAWKQTAAGRTYTLYDGEEPICELDATGAVTAVNTFGANGLLARHTAVGSVFYTFDQQGSTAQRLDGAGNVLTAHGFDAFGTSLTANAAPTDPYAGYGAQWGYRADAETGLLLLGQRYYDPASGRFLNRDPIGYEGGTNLYAYGEDDPIDSIDPTGLSVSVIFTPALGQISVRDDQTGEHVTVGNVWSGNGSSANNPRDADRSHVGPIPCGRYPLDTVSWHPHMHWRYKILVPNGDGGWTYENGSITLPGGKVVHRGEFNLHAGRASDGCVTVRSDLAPGQPGYPDGENWERIRRLIDKTKRMSIPHKKGHFSGWITVQ